MNELPRTIRTPEGLTVEGASPELLAELLVQYEETLEGLRPGCGAIFRPGLSRDEIVDRFEPLGYVPNEEVIQWWGWHDGLHLDREFVRPLGDAPLHLDSAIAMARAAHPHVVAPPEWLIGSWHPSWVYFDYTGTLAIRADRELTPPPVRPHQPEMGDHTQDAEAPAQVISLCTPVTWWITAIQEGWFRWNDDIDNFWKYGDEYPTEWWETRLV